MGDLLQPVRHHRGIIGPVIGEHNGTGLTVIHHIAPAEGIQVGTACLFVEEDHSPE